MPRTYPVDRLSFSAVKEFLANPWRFHRIYVLKISTFTDSPATLVGKAFHKCLELYYGSDSFRSAEGIKNAKEAGLSIIRAAAPQVDWGKTGSVEKAEADALQTIDHYFAEDPGYEKMGTLATERILQGHVKGIPVTLKAVSDLTIDATDESVGIVDFKKVSQLSVPEIPDEAVVHSAFHGIPPAYLIQGWFNQKALFASTTKKASWMKFHEVKTSKNKDGGSQVNVIHVDFTTPEWKAMDKVITKLVKNMLRDISRKNRVWFPNVSDQMAGEESWHEFLASQVPSSG